MFCTTSMAKWWKRSRKEVVEAADPMASRKQYWALWGGETPCSKHDTLAAALKAATQCEQVAGHPHTIVEVVFLTPSEIKAQR